MKAMVQAIYCSILFGNQSYLCGFRTCFCWKIGKKRYFFIFFVNFKVIWLLDRLPEPALLALKNLSEILSCS